MKFAKLTAVVALAVGLTACTNWDLNELKRVQMKGTPFQVSLAKMYRKYSEGEAAKYDWWSSQYFARKGLTAAYGRDVAPENPDNWDIPASIRPQVMDARKKLMEALNTDARTTMPEIAASAIVNFDCWVENLKEGWQADEIEGCRSRFFEELSTLQQSMIKGVPTVEYTIYFEVSSASLDSKGKQVIASVIWSIGDVNGDYEVIVNGHTDRVGSNEANLKMGMKRATVVKNALVQGGVKEKQISVFSFGETDPEVQTRDGVAERKNRRVEIYISE